MVQLSVGMDASAGAPGYERHRPEKTLLYQLVEQYYPAFVTQLADEGKVLPEYVHQEFDEYLKCGRLEYGFLRLQCDSCHEEQLVAFSCKRRGFCPSCGARRMAESAALLVDEVLPHRPMRQWVLSVPLPLRYLFASQPKVMGKVLGIVYRTLATHLIHKAGYKKSEAHTGAVTLIQRFGGALNLNIHFHMIFLDGVYVDRGGKLDRFRWVKAPTTAELSQLTHTTVGLVGEGWGGRMADLLMEANSGTALPPTFSMANSNFFLPGVRSTPIAINPLNGPTLLPWLDRNRRASNGDRDSTMEQLLDLPSNHLLEIFCWRIFPRCT